MYEYRNKLYRWFCLSGVWMMGIALAWLTVIVLRRLGIVAAIDGSINALGFDTERLVLLDSLILTLISSGLVGLLLQRRGPAWLGGLFYFVFHYLLPFIQQALHPLPGLDGQGQVVILDAFGKVLSTMFLLAFVLATVGAVLGQALGQVIIAPMFVLVKHLWTLLNKPKKHRERKHVPYRVYGSLVCGCLIAAALIVSAMGISPLLTYGPTTNIYQPTGTSPLMQHGQVQQGTFSSPALGGIRRNYWIYLPPSYKHVSSQRYPTLYLLHGSPGGPADWFIAGHAALTADVLIAEKKMPEMILIGADGNGPYYRFSEWANSFDGRQHMEDAIAFDLVSFIDSHYRTIAQAKERFIAGLSMGGYGAMNIGFHHPDIFQKIVSLGGYYQAEGSVFGTGEGSRVYRQLNSPSILLDTRKVRQALASHTLIIGVGTTDKPYYYDGVAFYQQLRLFKLPAHLLVNTGGHSWVLWTAQLREALPVLASAP